MQTRVRSRQCQRMPCHNWIPRAALNLVWCVRRYVAQVIAESAAAGGGEARPFYSFLESCLRHKAEMVIFEAARAICAMRDVSSRELAPAVTVLQLFLSSSKPVLRFAAVRTLNKARPDHWHSSCCFERARACQQSVSRPEPFLYVQLLFPRVSPRSASPSCTRPAHGDKRSTHMYALISVETCDGGRCGARRWR